jgi:aromatic-L-amino-acid decarboxylase
MTAADLDASLTLDPAELRRLGYRAVDAIAARIAALDDAPVGEHAVPDELHARLHEPLPEHGSDPEAVLDVVLRDVLSSGLRIDHTRFFAFTPLAGAVSSSPTR